MALLTSNLVKNLKQSPSLFVFFFIFLLSNCKANLCTCHLQTMHTNTKPKKNKNQSLHYHHHHLSLSSLSLSPSLSSSVSYQNHKPTMPSRPIPPIPSPSPPVSASSFLKTRAFFLVITISSSALILFIICYFVFYLWISIVHRPRTIPFDSSPPLKLQRFSYRELKNATNSFNVANTLGKGGSGTVYRGVLRDGKSVAVKRLDPSSLQAEREFQNELQILGGLRSPYLVTLLGFCVGKSNRILVYEFMPNRSLQESLFESDKNLNNLNLTWDRRFMIILDIARALSFLHLECQPPVIHGDVKPSNVLLDSDYRAKVSDFGLSRIKVEGEFGVEMFSQELGKSQELSGNLAGVYTGTATPTIGTPAESNNEVDFALALQASSSSKNSKRCYNVKALNLSSLNCSSNVSVVNEYDVKKRSKGKEVSIGVDVGGDDWNKFVHYDDELCSSIDHSKELNFNAGETAQWGKDWWWRQDGSGELCSKDYVTEWIGSQICPSENPDWDEGKKGFPEKTILSHSTGLEKLEDRNEMQFQEHRFGCPNEGFEEKNESRGWKTRTKKHMKMQEWWKEEHLDEISKKASSSSKNKIKKRLEMKWKKKGFKMAHFDLGRRLQHFKRRRKIEERNGNNDFEPNVEFSFRRGGKKNRTHSGGSEMWSGDLFSRELSSTTSMRGTLCYVAPEYGGYGYLMEKADIYSLGVLILVIVSGRRPLHILASPMKLEKANLVGWSRNLAQGGNILELVDERLVKDGYNKDQASLCINLALTCLQKMPELRPDIGDIVKILKGEMDLPPLPFEFSPSPTSKIFSRSRRKQKANAE